jgi:DNA mismatch endonuclease, patch repair protein
VARKACRPDTGLEMDSVTKLERSLLMSRIRSKDTGPELVVRSILHRFGYRFRLHRKDLPARPDIVLPRHRKIILVHGCFWHGHTCRLASKPKSNKSYWSSKIRTNRSRDSRNLKALVSQGWKVLELWECDIRKADGLEQKVQDFMRG